MTRRAPYLRDVSERREAPTINGVPPPSDLDAEVAVLSPMMCGEQIDELLALLEPADFYSKAHAIIFEAIVEMRRGGEAIDVVSVKRWLEAKGKLAQVGNAADSGLVYLHKLTSGFAGSGTVAQAGAEILRNALDHARRVRNLARIRRVIAEGHAMLAEAYTDATNNATEWLVNTPARFERVIREREQTSAVTLGSAVASAITGVQRAIEASNGGITGMPTGLEDLDEKTTGMHGSDVTFVSARRGGGKSAMASNIAVNVATIATPVRAPDGNEYDALTHGVLWISAEMSKEEIAARMACAQGRCDWKRFRGGKADSNDWARLIAAHQFLEHLPLEIIVDPHLTVPKIRAYVKQAAASFRRHGRRLKFVVVDYLQLISGRDLIGENEKREREVAEVARLLRALALEPLNGDGVADTHLMVLSQVNTDGELRESRAVEQHAVNIWHIEFDSKRSNWEPEVPDGKPARVRIRKQRGGAEEVVATCWWHPQFTLFSDEERPR